MYRASHARPHADAGVGTPAVATARIGLRLWLVPGLRWNSWCRSKNGIGEKFRSTSADHPLPRTATSLSAAVPTSSASSGSNHPAARAGQRPVPSIYVPYTIRVSQYLHTCTTRSSDVRSLGMEDERGSVMLAMALAPKTKRSAEPRPLPQPRPRGAPNSPPIRGTRLKLLPRYTEPCGSGWSNLWEAIS